MLNTPQQNVRQRRASHNRSDLEYILEELNPRAIAAKLEVSEITVQRWIDGTSRVPKAAVIALQAILGRLPGMETKVWNCAWINADGTIGVNGLKGRYRPESIYMLEYAQGLLQRTNAGLQRRIDELEAKLALLTRGDPDAGAANDGDLSVDLDGAAATVNQVRRYREASVQFWTADREHRRENYRRRIGWGR